MTKKLTIYREYDALQYQRDNLLSSLKEAQTQRNEAQKEVLLLKDKLKKSEEEYSLQNYVLKLVIKELERFKKIVGDDTGWSVK